MARARFPGMQPGGAITDPLRVARPGRICYSAFMKPINLCVMIPLSLALSAFTQSAFTQSAFAQPEDLSTPRTSFASADRLVGLYVFHWYTPTTGQTQGVWKPVEGRENWDGSEEFWTRQVKDMMACNPDLLLVHLIDTHEPQRINLFRALSALRLQGWQTPAVAPFLDPAITFYGPPDHQPHLDFAVSADRDTFADQFVRFFSQYYAASQDTAADSHLGRIDGKALLHVWAVNPPQIRNKEILTRDHLLTYLRGRYPNLFANGFFLGGPLPMDGIAWADEYNRSFVGYTGDYLLKDNNVASFKPGHYDTLNRFLARNGGQGYVQAWNRIIADPAINRAWIESWNEYTEGTGLYETGNLAPDLSGGGFQPHPDQWGPHGRYYIDLTAQKAAAWNRVPELASAVLWHNLPDRMAAGSRYRATVIVRNEGDTRWTTDYRFAQSSTDPVQFAKSPASIDPIQHETEKYSGVFRGRPVTFEFDLEAPGRNGNYETHWRMRDSAGAAFGATLSKTLTVDGGTDEGAGVRVR